jgi:hypothetical protein
MSYNTTLFGSPTVYTPTGNYTINSVQYNTDPGEIIIFEVAGGLLKEDPGGTTYPDLTLTITAEIQ